MSCDQAVEIANPRPVTLEIGANLGSVNCRLMLKEQDRHGGQKVIEALMSTDSTLAVFRALAQFGNCYD